MRYTCLFFLLWLFCQFLIASSSSTTKRIKPMTLEQERMHEERKKIQQEEVKLSFTQRRTLTKLAQHLYDTAPSSMPAISYIQWPQKRNGFVCSWRATPPSLFDFSQGAIWKRLSSSSSDSTQNMFQNIHDIFPILVQDGFRIAFLACSTCERVFLKAPRHCSWPDRNTITYLQKEEPFLYSCALPKSLWSAEKVTLSLQAGNDHKLELELDSLHLPASLPCHPPYRLSAATMVWAFREMFKTLQWIEYHRMVGVEHFWVYDNIRDPQRRLQRLLRYHIEAGLVTYVYDPVLAKNMGDRHFLANRHAANRFGMMWSEWLWIGDVDEYMLPPSCAQNMVDILQTIPDDVASVSVPGPKFTFDEHRWNEWKDSMEQATKTTDILLDIELYTHNTDFVPLERQKSITRSAAILDIANHQPTSFRSGYSKILQLNTSQLQFAHLFFHPWGRYPPQGVYQTRDTTLQCCYGSILNDRVRAIVEHLELSPQELYWYQWGHQQDQLAVNVAAEELFHNSKRRHPGGW